jgi:hypothetical protein
MARDAANLRRSLRPAGGPLGQARPREPRRGPLGDTAPAAPRRHAIPGTVPAGGAALTAASGA